MKEKEPERQDRWQALAIILGAYATAQGGLTALKLTGTVSWHWAAILTPSWIVCAVFLAAIITGTALGIRNYIRTERTKKKLREKILRNIDDILDQLRDGEEEDLDE